MKKAIELIRVSTEGQAAQDKASIPAQRVINRRTAQAYGLEIVRSIEMSDVSGAAVLHAPEIKELLRLMESPEIHGVVTREFSRLMRPENFSDYALLQAFVDTRTVLYLPEGPIDLTSKTGRLMGTIRAAIAGLERQEILERVWHAKEEKRRAGKLAQSEICLPYGVGYDEQRGWFYKPEAERVREVFKRVLSGDTNYVELAKIVGVTPRGMTVILRNPIYTGWRVIDKRRDPSPGASRLSADGRQGDRPKVQRSADEIIRVQVISPGLITEQQFQGVQRIMDEKKLRHWRCRPDLVPQYTYNGFLSCAECGELIYTSRTRNRFYYVCKAKKMGRASECDTDWMLRDRLEPALDHVFYKRLTDKIYLREIAQAYERMAASKGGGARIGHLQADMQAVKEKRQRILDTYFEGVIGKDERDARLLAIEDELARLEKIAMQSSPAYPVNADALRVMFRPLYKWQFLNRDAKRRILAGTVPEIRVADYRVQGLYLAVPSSNEVSRTGKGSSPPPA